MNCIVNNCKSRLLALLARLSLGSIGGPRAVCSSQKRSLHYHYCCTIFHASSASTASALTSVILALATLQFLPVKVCQFGVDFELYLRSIFRIERTGKAHQEVAVGEDLHDGPVDKHIQLSVDADIAGECLSVSDEPSGFGVNCRSQGQTLRVRVDKSLGNTTELLTGSKAGGLSVVRGRVELSGTPSTAIDHVPELAPVLPSPDQQCPPTPEQSGPPGTTCAGPLQSQSTSQTNVVESFTTSANCTIYGRSFQPNSPKLHPVS